MTIIKGPHVITGEDLGLPNEEDMVFEIKGDKIAFGVASTSLHHRVFDIRHISDMDDSSHNYHRIHTQDESKILVSTGPHNVSSFKNATHEEKVKQHSWWSIRHVSTSASGKSTYKIINKHTGRTLGDYPETVEFWTPSEFQSRVRRDQAQINAMNQPPPTYSQPVSQPTYSQPVSQPTYSQPATSNLCGNPTCGVDHICAADYNRNVRPMGYPGV